jgi:hypothetical protein
LRRSDKPKIRRKEMKKLMLVAMALASGAAMAIESANVVGYQNKTIADSTAGGYTWILSTLPSVGVAEDQLTLGSWVVTAPEGGLTSELSVRMNTFNTEGQIEGDYVYVDDFQASMYGWEAGWYTFDSIVNFMPESANNVIVPYGIGVQIGSDCGAIVTFAGQVAGERSYTINDSAAGGYTWTGNSTPINLTLKDFAITPPEGGLTSELSIRMNTFNAGGQIEGDFVYVDDFQASMYGWEAGWYTFESIVNFMPESVGDVPVASGEMFQIGSDCGATITVPSALPAAE